MHQVWERLDCSGPELLLALALADFANDQGANVFPSVATLASKTRQSARTIQRQLAEFRRVDWLLTGPEGSLAGGRGRSVRYRINPSWLNGDSLSWFSDRKGDTGDAKGCQAPPERVTSKAEIHDTAVSPDPSGSIRETSRTTRAAHGISDEDFDRIKRGYPKRSGSRPWAKARHVINARLRAGDTLDVMEAGLAAYASYLERQGWLDTQFVQQAATFFGPDRHFATDWSPPPSEAEVAERAAIEQQRARRSAMPLGMSGYREPEPGESAKAYCEAINREYDARKLQKSRDAAPLARQESPA